MQEKSRIVWIDILRIIAMFSVILIHVMSNTIYTFYIGEPYLSVYQILLSILSFAIPLFVMISGLIFLNPKKEMDTKTILKKYCFKILFLIFFFGTIFILIEQFYLNKSLWIPFDTLILKILSSNTWDHMWYLYIILGLYLITPVLRVLVKHISEKDFQYFLILLYICAFFIPEISHYFHIQIDFSIPIASPYLFYYLYGYYIVNYEVSKNYKRTSYILSLLSILLIICSYQNHWNLASMSYISTFSFLNANAVFLFFKDKSSKTFFHPLINSLGICSLGIYILHQVYINLIFKFFHWDMILSYPYIGLILYALGILMITYITVYLLRKIKFVRKIL